MIALDNGDKLRADASVANKVDYTVHGMVNDSVAQLSDGQLANAEADIYSSPGNAGLVATIIFVNTHTSAITCNLYLKPSGGTSRHIIPEDISIGAGYSLSYDGIRLVITDESGGDTVSIISHPVDTFVAEDGALGKGVLLQGDDGTDRKNVAVDTDGNVQVDVVGALPAGSAAIGKLAANSGVDIGDVDILSLPALPAGSAAIGKLAANSGVDIGDVDITSHPVDTFVAEDGALGKGILLQGDDGTDRKNVAVDTDGHIQIDIAGALPAGSAAIGKLAANSGIDIGDVDVLSLPALPAGSAKIGSVDAGKLSGTWTCISVNINTATTTELKAASAGHTYTVITISLTIAAENNLTWKSAANAKSGPMDFGKDGEPHGWQANFWPCGLKCIAGEALNLTTTTTGQVSGFITVLDES